MQDFTALQRALKSYWGYEDFLPMQADAISAVLNGQDSLTVLPTGGGKSLCFQAPAVCQVGLVVVVSPLVALMKDQVDGLRECGIAAAALHSGLSAESKRQILDRIVRKELNLLYLTPESLLKPLALDFLSKQNIQYFAIDEAHCISAWGHDFRPEYRELSVLRDRFAMIPIHAYTATANSKVRTEIVETLKLRNPAVFVGDFFRPNLQYHVVKKSSVINQVVSIIDRHPDSSGLIYCISRDETETLSAELQQLGYSCTAYHAGLSDMERTRRQDAFINDEVRIVVATIAFGMGIDKSDVRFVIHAGMPKSLSNYQQESGRGGRDGLECECWLLYAVNDMMIWRRINEHGSYAGQASAEISLADIHGFCVSTRCRHQCLCEHFGQTWTRERCNACDVCLGRFEQMADSLIVGQKILSCVLRVRETFGGNYVAKVLVGSQAADIQKRGHDRLSTFGLLKEFKQGDVRDWIEQLLTQGFLVRTGEYSVLKVTELGRSVLRGNAIPVLSRTIKEASQPTKTALVDSWEGVDMGLFERLKIWRREIAIERSVPAYIICGDVSLRDLARRRPTDLDQLVRVHGFGEKKVADFGATLVGLIAQFCIESDLSSNQTLPLRTELSPDNAGLLAASPLFAQGSTIEQVATQLARATSTVSDYLVQYLHDRQITEPSPWLSADEFDMLRAVIQYAGWERLKPIHEAIHGRFSYNKIRIAVAVLQNQAFQPIED